MDVSILSQVITQNYCDIIAMMILYYDHLMTLDDEIRYIWLRPNIMGSWIFLLNRYVAFFSTLTWILGFLKWTSVQRPVLFTLCRLCQTLTGIYDSCAIYNTYRQLLVGMIELFIAVNMFLRVYGLYGKDKRVLFLVLGISIPLAAVCAWNFSTQSSNSLLTGGCHVAIDPSSGIRLALAWESMLAYDVLIFSLTCFKTFTAIRRYQRHRTWGIAALMFRDGAMYYAILTCANLANIMTFYLLPPVLKGALSTIAGSISVTMVSRTMLNLYRTAAFDRSITWTMGANDALSTVVFIPADFDTPDSGSVDRQIQGSCRTDEARDIIPDVVPGPLGAAAHLASQAC